ncbi:MAG: hypothetical protein J7L64_03165 [Acidobacteria bacterium]|nr:hypothetical protein [Acidobacteriota bacterium]
MEKFTIDYENIDVAEIMEKIRRRIEEKKKKGIYSEEELLRLAQAKVASFFVQSSELKSDLVRELQRLNPQWNVSLSVDKLYISRPTTLGRIVSWVRRRLRLVAKLMFHINPLIQEINKQARINLVFAELIHNLIFELTKLRLDHEDLSHRLNALTRRVDFLETRERTLEELTLKEKKEKGEDGK